MALPPFPICAICMLSHSSKPLQRLLMQMSSSSSQFKITQLLIEAARIDTNHNSEGLQKSHEYVFASYHCTVSYTLDLDDGSFLHASSCTTLMAKEAAECGKRKIRRPRYTREKDLCGPSYNNRNQEEEATIVQSKAET
ncbi:hypothetical protein EVAR_69990_1 [Eumeta japonica]|uniref:Uncharacterized protein n=1 Tax=Eumeta variegata TaxID=151549 RepID=A0A4C1ZFN9_EUMVA|nr:hypothetical protein EVAR_69990_1 [Eumeta japonica]